MQILVLCAGKLRSVPLQTLCADYLLRLRRYGPCEIHEVRAPGNTPAEAVENEGAKFLACLEPGEQVWVLDERGQQWTSRQLAAQLGQCENRSVKRLALILGGAYGLSEEVKRRGRLWSLSPLTFPHELCRLILLEQLYRARTIQRGEPYHH